LVKSLHFTYETNRPSGALARLDAIISEKGLMLGLGGDGAEIRIGKDNQRVTQFPGTYGKGGRKSSVFYEQVSIGDKSARLPVRIEVRGPGNELLRSARLLNFKRINLTALEARERALEFSAFDSAHISYRNFLEKYWDKGTNDLSDVDKGAIKSLQETFADRLRITDLPASEVRTLNILMELSRTLGDTDGLERYYQRFLKTLEHEKLDMMVLVSGQTVIDTLMLWGRYREAGLLLKHWLSAASRIDDPDLFKWYASRELIKGNFWTTAELLMRCLDRPISADQRFEFTAMKTIANIRAKDLWSRRNTLNDKIGKAQAEWIAVETTSKYLDEAIQEGVLQTERYFKKIPSPPTESQTKLRADLIAMEEKPTKP